MGIGGTQGLIGMTVRRSAPLPRRLRQIADGVVAVLSPVCKKKCAATEAIETKIMVLCVSIVHRKKKCAATEAIETPPGSSQSFFPAE